MNDKLLTIQEAAEFLGISATTLRRYEERGVLVPPRTPGNQRRYTLKQVTDFKNNFITNAPPTSPTSPIDSLEKEASILSYVSKTEKIIFAGAFSTLSLLAFAVGVLKTQAIFTKLLNQSESNSTQQAQKFNQEGSILGESTLPSELTFVLNVPSNFKEIATFEKGIKLPGTGLISDTGNIDTGTGTITSPSITTSLLTAPNVVYSLKAGDGVSVSTGQTPTIANTGVLSLGSKTGAITLSGSLSISGSTLTATDNSTSLKIFKTITVGSDSFSAGNTTDTLTFVAGSGVSLSADTSNKKLTIANATGWQRASGIVSLSTTTDTVGINDGSASAPSLAFSNDSNTGLWRPGADTIAITTGGTATNGIRIDSSGNVGIGTASPLAKLDISGTASASGDFILGSTAGTSRSIQSTANNTLIIGGSTTGDIQFKPSGSTTNLYLSGSNVGIGTTSPTANLDVSGTASISGALKIYSTPTIQSTANQTLTIGGNTTGNIVLSPLGGSSGTITFSGYGAGVLKTSASGLVSAGSVNINAGSSEISGTLGIANGGTATTAIGSAGSVHYSNGTQYAFSAVGTSGQLLTSGGSGVPTWIDSSSISSGNFDQTLGSLYPKNATVDLFVGGVSTASAKFAVLNINSGTPTASVSAGAAGGTYLNATGNLQTTAFQTLTLGGSTTGNITLAPLNGITASYIAPSTNNQVDLGTSSLSFRNLYAGSVITGQSGAAGHIQRNDGAIAPTNITDDLLIGGISTASAKFQILGLTGNATTSGTLTFDTTGTIQATKNQTLTIGGSTTGNIALSPINGTGFVNLSGTLRFAGATPTISASATDASLVVNANGTGKIQIGNTAGGSTGNIELNGNGVASGCSITTGGTLTCLGSIISGGASSGFWDQTDGTLRPGNSTLDLFVGGVSTASAKFAVLNINSGTPTASVSAGVAGGSYLNATGNLQTTAFQTLTLGGSTTGNINLNPLNSTGKVTVNGTLNIASSGTLQIAASDVISAARQLQNIATIATDLLPSAGNTYSLGNSTTNQYLQLYSQNIYANGLQVVPYWDLNNGALNPKNSTVDLFVGGVSTASAKFAVLNINSGTPTASVSAGSAGGSYLTATGNLQTTANQTLTLGGSTTGNILLNPLNGSGVASLSGSFVLGSAAGTTRSIQSTANNTLTLGGNTTGNIILNPLNGSGSVGIGTTSPTATLHLKTAGSNTKGLIAQGNTGSVTSVQPDAVSGLTIWVKADSITAADGDAVATWNDSSANAYKLRQTTAADQPSYESGVGDTINGKPVVRFTAADTEYMNARNAADSANLDSSNVIAASEFTIFAVVKANTIADASGNLPYETDTLIGDNSGGDWGIEFNDQTADGVEMHNYDPTLDRVQVAFGTGTAAVMRARHTGGRLYIAKNGGTESSVASGVTANMTGDTVAVGKGLHATTAFLDADVAELIVYNTTLTSAQIAGVEKYLADKYAITVSAGAPTANLAEFQSDAGTILSAVDPNGYLVLATYGTTGDPTTSPVTGSTVYNTADNTLCIFETGASGWLCTGALTDFAEWTPAEEDVGIGDVVTISNKPNLIDDPDDPFLVAKTQTPYDTKMIGVVSKYAEEKEYANGRKKAPHYKAVALVGRVPVKVSTESGKITRGDFLTSSSTPGVAMKATRAGQVIGKAVEEFSCHTGTNTNVTLEPETIGSRDSIASLQNDDTCQGEILIFVNPTWHDPAVFLTNSGDLNITQLTANGDFALANVDGSDITTQGAFKNLIAANIKTGKLTAKQIGADQVLAKQITSDTVSTTLLTTDNIKIQGQNLDDYLNNYLAEKNILPIQNFTTSNSSPSSSLQFASFVMTSPSSVIAIPPQAEEAISSSSSAISNNSMESKLKNLNEQFNDLSNKVNILSNIILSTPTSSLRSPSSVIASASEAISSDGIASSSASWLTPHDDFASLLDLGGASAIDMATISGNLTVSGRTLLADLGIAGKIQAGFLSIDGFNNDIHTLTGDLKLQKSGLGGLDILNGKVTIDTSGNIATIGKVKAKEVTTEKVNIKPLVSDSTASPSAILSTSASSIIIKKGEIFTDVKTTTLTAESLIFVTPEKPVAVGSKIIDNKTIRITLKEPIDEDIKVNWWIIN